MKLVILLSVIACSHAAKLDRTYLPPESAATAGGSSDSLRTPVGPSGFGAAGQTQAGSTGTFAPSGPSQFGTGNGAFGNAVSNQLSAPSTQYGQPTGPSFDSGFAQPAQNFGNQAQKSSFGNQAQNFGNEAQNFQRNQPERAQASADRNAEILRLDNQNDGETFSYNFETSNGIAAEESGVATNGVQAQGAFSYSGDDGQQYRVVYTADENGYQPQGDHLPTPPPIPEEIMKSIEQNARAAAAGTQEGAYNPDEDNSPVGPQAYNYNGPTSYQGSTGASGPFNQAQGNTPNQAYGAPNAGSPSRITGAQNSQGLQYGVKSQALSQQYGTPTGTSDRPQTSQQYLTPNAGSSFVPQGPSQQYIASSSSLARPNNFQGPSQQYRAPNGGSPSRQTALGQSQSKPSSTYGTPNGAARPSSFNANQGTGNGFAPSGSGSRPSSLTPAQAIANQYQAQPSQYSRPGSPQQAQDDSGYQYDRPQGSFGSTGQGTQGGFSGPNAAVTSQGPFGGSQNYGAAAGSNAAGPKGRFGAPGHASLSAQDRPTGKFNQPQGQSFGSPSNQGFNRPGTQMSDSGYQYSQPQGLQGSQRPQGPQISQGPQGAQRFGNQGPQGFGSQVPQSLGGQGSQGFGNQGPQSGFKASPQAQGQTFGAPRQPPSFTEEEGYKY